MKLLFTTHVVSTLMMVGVIWLIQIVHYPLFNRVGLEAFPVYAAAHVNRISCVVGPLMAVEAITAFALVIQPPVGLPRWSLMLGFALVVVIWLSTLLIQTPQHGALTQGFSESHYRMLVQTNWLRTAAWTIRALLVVGWLIVLLDTAAIPSAE
jgi:hypothetical protein